ncbi:hypothetical protein MLD38_033800 [Melastoma candidum]|uniref:Uncharacterized protein n=1 Tax=Melastoma candidum TaxID=119954 RepID=A0ACB9MAJ2_9MYRT|nr:hypothetical protein MLD38_033800 [Melastoma candidum]
MENSVGDRNNLKIMKIEGEEMIKLKPPVQASDVLKDYPAGYVLLDPDSVWHFGIGMSPLDPDRELKAKKLYFLVKFPSFPLDNLVAPRQAEGNPQTRSGLVGVSKQVSFSLMEEELGQAQSRALK